METLTIGKLAIQAGVGVETVRFYERKGLIRKPPKRETGFRSYSVDTASRIRFIRRAQGLGFTLREVGEFVELQFQRKMTGAQVQMKAEEKIREIRAKIEDLKRMERALRELSHLCGTGERAIQECPLFDCFGRCC